MLSNGYNPADAINEVSKEYGLTKEDVIKYYEEEFKINPLCIGTRRNVMINNELFDEENVCLDNEDDSEESIMDGCPDFDDHSGDEVEDEYDPKKHIKYTEEEEEAFAIADALEVLDALGDNDE